MEKSSEPDVMNVLLLAVMFGLVYFAGMIVGASKAPSPNASPSSATDTAAGIP